MLQRNRNFSQLLTSEGKRYLSPCYNYGLSARERSSDRFIGFRPMINGFPMVIAFTLARSWVDAREAPVIPITPLAATATTNTTSGLCLR